jgi:hypothetical protein
VVSFTPRSLYPEGKSLWYPLDTRLVILRETTNNLSGQLPSGARIEVGTSPNRKQE